MFIPLIIYSVFFFFFLNVMAKFRRTHLTIFGLFEIFKSFFQSNVL